MSRVKRPARGACVLLAAVGLGACIPSSVVAPDDRGVRLAAEELAFRPARAEDLPGVWIGNEFEGPLAAVLSLVVYRFEPEGAYTGAALIEETPPRFEVISGSWKLEAGSLSLDQGPPARAEVSDGVLRLAGEEGGVLLRREELR